MKPLKIIYKLIFCTALVFFYAKESHAQNQDFGLWTGFEFERKINKRFDIEGEIGHRLKDNLNQRDESFAGIGISWSKKRFSLSTGYRFTNEKTDENHRIAHRVVFQGSYNHKLNRLTFQYRPRLQIQYKAINSSKNGHLPESFLRNRFKLDYNIKGIPLKPLISYELFYRFNQYTDKKTERQRWVLGMNYKLDNNNRIGLAFIIHESLNTTNTLKRYILEINYKLEI